ncbi:MAG: CoA transferase [Planctomycetes bacterium]|nr:CoA transferase [Planctomycetota bacterium]
MRNRRVQVSTGAERAHNREALKALVEGWASGRPTADVDEVLRCAEIPAAPVRGKGTGTAQGGI